ncbi:MAG: hypothetical protein AAGH92_05195 [Planctomycetota bacterium]
MAAPAEFEIGPETETPTHWSYAVTVFDAGRTRSIDVTLSFQDYDHWSRGRVPPVKVVDATMRFALTHMSLDKFGETLDCSTIARRYSGFDAALNKAF